MKEIKTILIGLGTVNIGFLKILIDKKKQIEAEYGLVFIIVGIADSSGVAVNMAGFDFEQLIDWKAAKKKVNQLPGHRVMAVENITEHVAADLLIESSAGNLKNGMPGLAIVRNALRKGISVVLANKAPLVFAFDELHAIAHESNAGI